MDKFEELMAEEETREKMKFLLSLEKKDFLMYIQIVMDMHQHKVDNGNSATDAYVERKNKDVADENKKLKQKNERLHAEKDKLHQEKADLLKDTLRKNETKLNQIYSAVSEIADKDKKVKTAAAIGQQGEDWVLDALQMTFPANGKTKVAKTGQNGCGDLVLAVDGKRIMFEVKNYQKGTVKGQGKGKEVEKFFLDAQQTSLGYRFDAAVLISLNCPVDLDVPTMFPKLHKQSKMPYMYVDNAEQYEDPVTLFRSVVSMMLFLIKHVEDNEDPEAMGTKVEMALKHAKGLQALYQELRKKYNETKKPLDQMKIQLEEMLEELGGPTMSPKKRPASTHKNTSIANVFSTPTKKMKEEDEYDF